MYGIPAPPPQPPGNPSAVKSGTTANVSWTASSSTDVANYLVYQWNGTNAWALATNGTVPGSTLTTGVTGLTPGTRYYFHVCAQNARGKRCNQHVAFVDI
ncbi:MAG: fibronectin type III domain-containing protein [Chloroflexi bacterium]|nr:fibronectin type III domain-containing protein [Chloroflexota bacterium]